MAFVIIWGPGGFEHAWNSLKTWLRKRLRSKIFDAIDRDDRERTLAMATPRRLQSARDEFGCRPVVACIAGRRPELAVALIERGGYVRGDGAVAHAAMSRFPEVLKKLIDAGADLNEPLPPDPLERGWTPLMWATNRHNFEGMRLLLAAGAGVNAVARDGTTAVMCTSEGKDDDLVALDILCSYKPDLTMKDWRGRTILDEARDRARFSNKTAMRDILYRYFPEIKRGET